jgi:hypothetical protein
MELYMKPIRVALMPDGNIEAVINWHHKAHYKRVLMNKRTGEILEQQNCRYGDDDWRHLVRAARKELVIDRREMQ